jgi:prolyl 4-hydroxylase
MYRYEDLLAWAQENLDRGCKKEEIKSVALSSPWPKDIVDQVINTLLIDGSVENTSLKLPGPDLTDNKTSITVDGREIKIIFTFNLPKVVLFGNFLSDEECDQLVEMARPNLTRSSGVDAATGQSHITDARTSSGTFFRKGHNDLIRTIDRRVSQAINWPEENGEDLQILRYENNEQYMPHHDYFIGDNDGITTILSRGGQRIATVLLYLATPEQGGATAFPDVGLQVSAQKGNALFFLYPTATADTLTRHAGTPVIKGEKFVATKWYRQGKFS